MIVVEINVTAKDAVLYNLQPGPRVLALDPQELPEDERQRLSDEVRINEAGELYLTSTLHRKVAADVSPPTVDGLRAEIRRRINVDREAQAEKERYAAKRAEATRQVLEERRTEQYREMVGKKTPWTRLTPDWPYLADDSVRNSPEAKEWEDSLNHQNERAKAEAEAEEEARKAVEQAEKDRVEEDKRQWIEQHATSRLKKAYKYGFEHEAIYRDERIAHDVPGWSYDDTPWEFYDPRNPTVEALSLYEAHKDDCDGVELVWVDEAEDGRGYTCTAEYLGWSLVLKSKDGELPVPVVTTQA